MMMHELSWRSPYTAFAPLAAQPGAHLLHGGDALKGARHWSILVAFPTHQISAEPDDDAGWLSRLQGHLTCRRPLEFPVDAPFFSGAIGFVGYEALVSFEPTLALPPSPYGFPDAWFGFYEGAVLFDRAAKRTYAVGRSKAHIDQLLATIGSESAALPRLPAAERLSSNFSKEDYETAVTSVIERIRAGDFYQANIAQTLRASFAEPFSAFSLFRQLAEDSDAFFSALLQFPEGAIISNSPERFFRLRENRIIETAPIKGTRPRGRNASEDAELASELLNDPKDRAENIMIADLMRNDLSKICEEHSVREVAVCELLTLSRVHHLVSKIHGTLRDGVTVFDIFKALFPSGSITGAPKIEAMRTIAELEETGRGPYCGAIGYIDDRGLADFSVSIRTMMTSQDGLTLAIPVGGGVTLRSEPEKEFDETLVKAGSGLSALGLRGAIA